MKLSCDSAGNVLVASTNTEAPVVWNGQKTVVYTLTRKQESIYNSLTPNGGIVFDGDSFTTLPPIASVPVVDRVQIILDELASKPDASQKIKDLARGR